MMDKSMQQHYACGVRTIGAEHEGVGEGGVTSKSKRAPKNDCKTEDLEQNLKYFGKHPPKSSDFFRSHLQRVESSFWLRFSSHMNLGVGIGVIMDLINCALETPKSQVEDSYKDVWVQGYIRPSN